MVVSSSCPSPCCRPPSHLPTADPCLAPARCNVTAKSGKFSYRSIEVRTKTDGQEIEVRTKYTVDAREYGNLRECEVLAQQAVDRDRPQVSHQGGARVARRGIFLKRHWNTILSLFYSDFCFARARRRLFLRSSRCGIQPQILCLF